MKVSPIASLVIAAVAWALIGRSDLDAQRPRVFAVSAPVPEDLHEPVAGRVQVPSTPAARAAAFYLLERARQNSLIHRQGMQPYRFTMSFVASGNVSNTGAGELTETWINGRTWRWTVNLANISVVRAAYNGQLLENNHVEIIPTRAHMLRNEIFWAVEQYTVKAQIRTAAIQWNGKSATCILASGVSGDAVQSQTRLWQDEEYCVDNDSGLLVVHSIAPGIFANFSYTSNQQFHGRAMPDRIAIYVGGSLVADGSFGIVDATFVDESSIGAERGLSSNLSPVQVQMPYRMPLFCG